MCRPSASCPEHRDSIGASDGCAHERDTPLCIQHSCYRRWLFLRLYTTGLYAHLHDRTKLVEVLAGSDRLGVEIKYDYTRLSEFGEIVV